MGGRWIIDLIDEFFSARDGSRRFFFFFGSRRSFVRCTMALRAGDLNDSTVRPQGGRMGYNQLYYYAILTNHLQLFYSLPSFREFQSFSHRYSPRAFLPFPYPVPLYIYLYILLFFSTPPFYIPLSLFSPHLFIQKKKWRRRFFQMDMVE